MIQDECRPTVYFYNKNHFVYGMLCKFCNFVLNPSIIVQLKQVFHETGGMQLCSKAQTLIPRAFSAGCSKFLLFPVSMGVTGSISALFPLVSDMCSYREGGIVESSMEVGWNNTYSRILDEA